ncbi:MAG: hypothetical protein RJB13_821 [Pseudomonadota bacterium]
MFGEEASVLPKYMSQLNKFESAVIVAVREGHPLSERMVELGFIGGETVSVLHEAPLSRDPIVVECGGVRLALRREEASLVEVAEAHVMKGQEA